MCASMRAFSTSSPGPRLDGYEIRASSTSLGCGMPLVDRLYPVWVVQDAGKQTQDAFVARHGATIVLVRVSSATTELANGLLACASGGIPPTPTDGLGYETVTITVHSAKGDKKLRAPGFTIDRLRKVLAQGVHVIVPLRKRPGAAKPFAGRISVGRARNNDIVLRDPSVSKFHAWFECDEAGHFYVGDARSKNTTKLNGHRIETTGMTHLEPGDELQFGAIDVFLSDASTLWQAIAES